MSEDDLTGEGRGESGRHTRFPPKPARRKAMPETPPGAAMPGSHRGRGTRKDPSERAGRASVDRQGDAGSDTGSISGSTSGSAEGRAPASGTEPETARRMERERARATTPPPASGDAAPVPEASIFDDYGAQWEKRHRRVARWRRVGAVARKLAWLIVALVPLALLSADVGTTMRCDLPSALVDARLRQQWLATWAVSTAVVLPLALFIAVGAGNAVGFITAVLLAAVWKVAVLLRDRVALPACPQGWSEAVPRHALEVPLSLVAGASFAAFLVALAVLAWSPRRQSSG